MKITDKGKLRKIKEICRRYLLGLCVKCGTDEDMIDKKEIDYFICSICGFKYYRNWHFNYIEAIEKIIKEGG